MGVPAVHGGGVVSETRYKVKYQRDMWGWVAEVYDRQEPHIVYSNVWPVPLSWLRRRVARAIAHYEQGKTVIRYSS